MDLIFVIILGGLWGSFANVCIYRLPMGKGVVSGRSFCPKCKKLITWKDNIPIISFLFLNGKCRNCKKNISPQFLLFDLPLARLAVPQYMDKRQARLIFLRIFKGRLQKGFAL